MNYTHTHTHTHTHARALFMTVQLDSALTHCDGVVERVTSIRPVVVHDQDPLVVVCLASDLVDLLQPKEERGF